MPKKPPAHNQTSAPTKVAGQVERVVFHNEASGWSVLRVNSEGTPITVVGVSGPLHEGEAVEAVGRWVDDPRFGRQFKAEVVKVVSPTTVEGMRRYLATCGLPGVGETLAQRLVDTFGHDVFQALSDPSRIREVQGIGPKKAQAISEAWAGLRAERDTLVELLGLGLGVGVAHRVWRVYGDEAARVVRTDPFALCEEVDGVGFKTADAIAQKVGIAPTAPRRIGAGIAHCLREATEEGHSFLPAQALVARAQELLQVDQGLVVEELESLAASGRVVVEEGAVYLAPMHRMEVRVARALAWRAAEGGTPSELSPGEESLLVDLDADQREAVRACLGRGIAVVTGGPGTGKTTLVKHLCRLCDLRGIKVALCAPTGRAAKRLEEATGKRASTIHRLLEFDPLTMTFGRNEHNPLRAELVVVDEASMVDLPLMDCLVAALEPGCGILLVGDADQLPPVGPGAVLRETVDCGHVPVFRLTKIHRQAMGSLIVVNAHRVNRGLLPLEDYPGCTRDLYLVREEDPDQVLRVVLEWAGRRVLEVAGVDPVRDLQVLTPMRKGPLGSEHLNVRLQELLNPHGRTLTLGHRSFRVGDRVMQVVNDYSKMVFNGELGVVEDVDTEEGKVTVSFEGRPLVYSPDELEELSLAYASTVHKAQGSEFPAVIVVVHTQHWVMLRRNLLYTALTRGKKLVVLVGSWRAVAVAVQHGRVDHRYSKLGQRIAQARASLG